MNDLIGIISFSEIKKDSRVKREINTLKKNYKIICFGYGDNFCDDIQFIKLKEKNSFLELVILIILFISFRFKKFTYLKYSYGFLLSNFKKYNINYFLLNDYNTWPLIDYINSNNCILDAHEYTPEEFNNNLFWKIFIKKYKKWCSNFASKSSVNFCFEQNLCDKWTNYTDSKFKLLRNFAPHENSNLNYKINFPIKIVHHGIANKSRKIEKMILAIKKSGPSYKGFFYLDIKDKSLDKKLKKISYNSNVNVLKPIPEEKIISECSNYDLAIVSIYPTNINYKFCLPNKFFQFLQSKLPIISGPTPSISKIIKKYDIGVVAKSFEENDLANAILSITKKDILRMKRNCYIAAKELCWENESKKLSDAFIQIKK